MATQSIHQCTNKYIHFHCCYNAYHVAPMARMRNNKAIKTMKDSIELLRVDCLAKEIHFYLLNTFVMLEKN